MRKHEFDLTAFVWGLLFLAGAGVVAVDEYQHVSLDLRWLLPTAFVVLGISGIANTLGHNRK